MLLRGEYYTIPAGDSPGFMSWLYRMRCYHQAKNELSQPVAKQWMLRGYVIPCPPGTTVPVCDLRAD